MLLFQYSLVTLISRLFFLFWVRVGPYFLVFQIWYSQLTNKTKSMHAWLIVLTVWNYMWRRKWICELSVVLTSCGCHFSMYVICLLLPWKNLAFSKNFSWKGKTSKHLACTSYLKVICWTYRYILYHLQYFSYLKDNPRMIVEINLFSIILV